MKIENLTKYMLASCVMLCSSYFVAAHAKYPERPIRLIVGSAPGGGGDAVARVMAESLSKKLDTPIIVENRPGASGNIGELAVAHAAPDGYTLLFAYTGHVINPSLFKDPSFDTAKYFRGIARIGSPQSVLVANPKVPAKNLPDFISLIAKEPGHYSMASMFGTDQYVAAQALVHNQKLKVLFVPYKGNGPALIDVISGQVSAMINTVGVSVPFIRSGKLRALAIVDSKRSSLLPDVPTLQEQGVTGVESTAWYGLLAPVDTSDDVVAKLSHAVKASLDDAAVVKRLRNLGVEPKYLANHQFDKYIQSELMRWKEFFDKTGIVNK
ncbi:Bug family tripartite tricarboxylate transporter substrate binding protein [Candidimonas nitroreducens]|uniref:LacI family transcriptional regulator n=1 Tax=Candidimonas nitroreducens TaxID=683354 RepID=A0A225LWN9_9BURK|nr:tripartite tricarboxylate transporter substrate binding protein [Candidimonas nitroreducens]OWT53727.1 hypothetical protein CEY11_23685 [Candidimonas nitroreducens]